MSLDFQNISFSLFQDVFEMCNKRTNKMKTLCFSEIL